MSKSWAGTESPEKATRFLLSQEGKDHKSTNYRFRRQMPVGPAVTSRTIRPSWQGPTMTHMLIHDLLLLLVQGCGELPHTGIHPEVISETFNSSMAQAVTPSLRRVKSFFLALRPRRYFPVLVLCHLYFIASPFKFSYFNTTGIYLFFVHMVWGRDPS